MQWCVQEGWCVWVYAEVVFSFLLLRIRSDEFAYSKVDKKT